MLSTRNSPVVTVKCIKPKEVQKRLRKQFEKKNNDKKASILAVNSSNSMINLKANKQSEDCSSGKVIVTDSGNLSHMCYQMASSMSQS